MKATLLLTMACNLSCDYCYVEKRKFKMSSDTIKAAVEFVFDKAGESDRLYFGLFGGEPLLAWKELKLAVSLIRKMSEEQNRDVQITLATNGTLLREDYLTYIRDNQICVQISCDGIADVHDSHRRFSNLKPTSKIVESKLLLATEMLPTLVVNVVYRPDTFDRLPESIEYLESIGVKNIVLNPDYSAEWLPEHSKKLNSVYDKIADLYIRYYENETPLFISLIDEKVAVILRGGYGSSERCHMGYTEFAFSPRGYIFPCERLVGDGFRNDHCIGHLDQPDLLARSHCDINRKNSQKSTCSGCSVKQFCMNWCSCSNFHGTGNYLTPSRFICESEKSSISSALRVLENCSESQNLSFINHYSGFPMLNSVLGNYKGGASGKLASSNIIATTEVY